MCNKKQKQAQIDLTDHDTKKSWNVLYLQMTEYLETNIEQFSGIIRLYYTDTCLILGWLV